MTQKDYKILTIRLKWAKPESKEQMVCWKNVIEHIAIGFYSKKGFNVVDFMKACGAEE